MPHSKSLSLYWRRVPQWYRLEGTRCSSCSSYYFPVRSICPECRREGKLNNVKFSGRGTIESYTTVHAPPAGFELQKPYTIGIIKLEEGPKLTAQIVDCEPGDVKIGGDVQVVFRKIREGGGRGVIHYGYKFKPV